MLSPQICDLVIVPKAWDLIETPDRVCCAFEDMLPLTIQAALCNIKKGDYCQLAWLKPFVLVVPIFTSEPWQHDDDPICECCS